MFDLERSKQICPDQVSSLLLAKHLSVSNLLYVKKADRTSVVNIFCMLSQLFCILFDGAKICRGDTAVGDVFCKRRSRWLVQKTASEAMESSATSTVHC